MDLAQANLPEYVPTFREEVGIHGSSKTSELIGFCLSIFSLDGLVVFCGERGSRCAWVLCPPSSVPARLGWSGDSMMYISNLPENVSLITSEFLKVSNFNKCPYKLHPPLKLEEAHVVLLLVILLHSSMFSLSL